MSVNLPEASRVTDEAPPLGIGERTPYLCNMGTKLVDRPAPVAMRGGVATKQGDEGSHRPLRRRGREWGRGACIRPMRPGQEAVPRHGANRPDVTAVGEHEGDVDGGQSRPNQQHRSPDAIERACAPRVRDVPRARSDAVHVRCSCVRRQVAHGEHDMVGVDARSAVEFDADSRVICGGGS